jgi:hypothetical protein
MSIERGRSKRVAKEANSAEGIDGSMGSVGAPWEMKTVGRRDIAANLKKSSYHEYRDDQAVDKQPARQ